MGSSECEPGPQNLTASILPPVLITELILGLPGNIMALIIFCYHLRCWRPNILYLFNLIVADFLLLVSLPFRIDNYLHSDYWRFGNAWCRMNLFILAVNRSASIGFMTAVAVDRYFKIVHPHFKVNKINSRQASAIACFIWIVVILLRVPLLSNDLLLQNTTASISYCRSFSGEDPSLGIRLHHMVYIGEFFLPLMLLFFCSIRIFCILRQRKITKEKKVQRAMRTVLVIVGVFVLCFFPGIATGLTALYLKKLGNEYCKSYTLTGQLFTMSIGFTYLNSVLDPVIYCFSSSMFRNAIMRYINRFGFMEIELVRRRSTVSASDG